MRESPINVLEGGGRAAMDHQPHPVLREVNYTKRFHSFVERQLIRSVFAFGFFLKYWNAGYIRRDIQFS